MSLTKCILPIAHVVARTIYKHVAAKQSPWHSVGSFIHSAYKAIMQQTIGFVSVNFLHEGVNERRFFDPYHDLEQDHDPDQDHDLVHDLDEDHDLDPGQDQDPGQDDDHDLDQGHDLDHDPDQDKNHDPDQDHDLDQDQDLDPNPHYCEVLSVSYAMQPPYLGG